VWAWHKSRMRQLAENVDRLAVVLPFEEELFRSAGAKVHFVGHPLLDVEGHAADRATFCRTLNLDPVRPILALFPGSRPQEVHRHLELFCVTAQRVRARQPRIEPVIAAAPGIDLSVYRATKLPHTSDTTSLLKHARAALVKSGTTTLQTGLAGVPMVVTYQMNPITYRVARRVVDVPHVALVNLVADERVVPELIQDAARPSVLADALLPLIADGPARDHVLAGLARVREKLRAGANGTTAAQRVTQLAAELIEAP
jgi:lipid-A-disaccharide synthase